MGLFSKKKPLSTESTKASRPLFTYVDSSTSIENEVMVYRRDLLGSIKQMLDLIPLAQAAIPRFKSHHRAGYVSLGKVAENSGKSQPYQDRVQVITENDVYHFWFYPSGTIWKAECYFWPENEPGFYFKVRRPDNKESNELAFEEIGIKLQINQEFTAKA